MSLAPVFPLFSTHIFTMKTMIACYWLNIECLDDSRVITFCLSWAVFEVHYKICLCYDVCSGELVADMAGDRWRGRNRLRSWVTIPVSPSDRIKKEQKWNKLVRPWKDGCEGKKIKIEKQCVQFTKQGFLIHFFLVKIIWRVYCFKKFHM